MHGSRWTLMLKKLSTHHVHDRHLCSSGMEVQNVEMDSDLHISRWCQPPQAMTWRYIGGPGPADCWVTSVWRQQSKAKCMWILTSLQLQPEARTPSEWSAVLVLQISCSGQVYSQIEKQKVVIFDMNMQQKSTLTGQRAVVVMCAVLLLMGQQVSAQTSQQEHFWSNSE